MSQLEKNKQSIPVLLVELRSELSILEDLFQVILPGNDELQLLLKRCKQLCNESLTLLEASSADPNIVALKIRRNCAEILDCTTTMCNLFRKVEVNYVSEDTLQKQIQKIQRLIRQQFMPPDTFPEEAYMKPPSCDDCPSASADESKSDSKRVFCPYCGSLQMERDVFCHNCGSRLVSDDRKSDYKNPPKNETPTSTSSQTASAFCPGCGIALAEDKRFCHYCGCDIISTAERNPHFCSACGYALTENAARCPQCGKLFSSCKRREKSEESEEYVAPKGIGHYTFCNDCGSRIPEYHKYCPICGSRNWMYRDAYPEEYFPASPPSCSSMPSVPLPNASAPRSSRQLDTSFHSVPRPPKIRKKKVKTVPPLRADEVQFRGAAPMVIRPGRFFTVKIMVYREDDYQRADRESATVGDKRRITTSGLFKAKRDQVFQIRLQSAAIALDEFSELRWNGKYAVAEFQVFLPEDYDQDQLRLLGRVYDKITPLTDLVLILEVTSGRTRMINIARKQKRACEKASLRTAFVSYASKDRSEVAKRIQGMESVRPDMDIFFDRKDLIRGEEYEPRIQQEIHDRDLFLLFWSRNAAASEWVNKELTYALSHKPETQIEPIPLEAPEVCPPPEKLKHRHFWDWTMQYTT